MQLKPLWNVKLFLWIMDLILVISSISYLIITKNSFYVEANARNMYAKYQLHISNSF